MLRKTATAVLLLLALSTSLLGHAGEVHSYMGTITAAGENGAYTMKTTKGASVEFVTSPSTRIRFADNASASAADLRAGARVVVEISKDGRTATSIKIAK